MDEENDPALSTSFTVKVDNALDLGAFTSCEGLGAEVVLEQREEGGNNRFVHQLPVRLKYSNVKLTRPVNKSSNAVAAWFSNMGLSRIERSTVEITARKGNGDIVATWNLDGVIPVRWQGPSLNVETTKAAMETLELAHHGFLKA